MISTILQFKIYAKGMGKDSEIRKQRTGVNIKFLPFSLRYKSQSLLAGI